MSIDFIVKDYCVKRFVMIERVYKIVMFGNEGVGKIGKEVFVIYFLFV